MRIGKAIYLDYQATAPLDSRVMEKMKPYFAESIGNPHSVDHFLGWQASRAVEEAAAEIGELIGAESDEIIFTSGATESNNLALLGLGGRAAGGKRRRVLVSAIEHKCVLAAGRVLHDRLGYQVELLPVDREGRVNISSLKESVKEDVLLVSIMAVNNEIGTIQKIKELSDVIRESGALFHCDAAQAPCAMDLSAIAEHVDLLSLSGHKMHGPMGIGALFIRRDLQDRVEPLIYGGGQQHDLRSGTVPVALCAGMAAAASLLQLDEANNERLLMGGLRDRFVRDLTALPWPVALNGPGGEKRHPGNTNIRFEGFDAQDVLNALQPHLAASTGSACASGFPEPSHVLKSIGLSTTQAEESIRFSLGRGTTETDIDDALALIDGTLSRLSHADLVRSA
ncbi:MAG: cysteine desulfurase [Rhodospirillales bacterium]|nr:cysteine desulfurase [Rhodospirillales bacterium]